MSSAVTPSSALTQIESIAGQLSTLAGQVSNLSQNVNSLAQEALAYVPPTPPLDVFSYWTPKAGKSVKPCFVRLLPDGRLAAYFTKNPAGWPMDIQIADGAGVYFRLTDTGTPAGWPPNGASSNFRLYTQQNPSPSVSLGFMISPRYYSPSQGRVLVESVADVPTAWYTGCAASATNPVIHHLGPAQSFISQQTVEFGESLGTQVALVCEYYYTVHTQTPLTFKTREQFYLTADSGWVWWDVATLQAEGTYAITNASHPNTFIADNAQVPVLPCSIVL